MVKYINSLIVFLLFTNTVLSGFTILNLPHGGRAVSLGENLCALPEEIENIYYNPAGLVGIQPFELKFMYFKWVADINIGNFLLAKSFKNKSTLGTSFSYVWTQLESENQSSDYYSLINNLVYSIKFNKTYFGLGLTILHEKISLEERNNLAVGINLGLLLRFQRFSFGTSVRNIGQSFTTIGSATETIPTNLNFGISYITSNHIILLSNVKYNLNGHLSIHTGLELPIYRGIREDISIRVGNIVKLTEDSEISSISNFRFGLGFKKEGLKIDYSFVPLGEIGFFHYLSLGFMFY